MAAIRRWNGGTATTRCSRRATTSASSGSSGLAILLAGMLAATWAQARTGVIHPWLALCVVLALGIFETPLGFLGDAQSTLLALAVVLLIVADPTEDSWATGTASDLEPRRPTFITPTAPGPGTWSA